MLNNQLTLFDQISNSENLDCQTNHIEVTKEKSHPQPTQSSDENSLDHPSCPTLLEYGERRASSMWPGISHRKAALRGIRWFSEYKDYGKLTLDEITRKHIYEFIEHLQETRNISGSTCNRYQVYITRVISEANDREVTTNHITKLKQAPETKVGRPRCFTLEEEASLIKHLRNQNAHWFADMCILSFNTGMRKGEILAINDPEVKLNDGFLFLPAHVCKNKTGRDVPLNDKALSAYTRLKDIVDEYTEKKFANYWNKARRDIARGDKHFVFHVCRHTAASRLADRGFNQRYIAEILGHRDERTTSKYVHPNKDILKNAVNTL